MTRSRSIRAATLLAVVLLAAGCLSGGPIGDTPTETPTPDTPTSTSDGVTAEYVVRAGEVPDEFESVTLTFRAVFVDQPADLGPCYPEVFSGPYQPTITPLPTPAGDCHRSDPVSVNLTGIEGERSLGSFAAPGSARGHALIVTDVAATYPNGTSVSGIKGTGGHVALASSNPPDGSYGVEMRIGTAEEGLRYDYWLGAERFEPSG